MLWSGKDSTHISPTLGANTDLTHVNNRPSCQRLKHSSVHLSRMSTMASSQQKKGRDGVLSALDVLIQALSLAKDTCGIPPAQIALGSAAILLTMIRVRFLFLLENGLLTCIYPRTRWPTNRITSTLGRLAEMCAKCSTEN